MNPTSISRSLASDSSSVGEAPILLDAVETRVLGALLEKQIATPDYYPLTLNALVNACNQLTNREPVVAYDDATVLRAIDTLREKRLATHYHGAESRVAKYRHALHDVILLTPAETALLCVLLLRGPQTVGELRTRSERLFVFDSLPEVESALAALATRVPPLVVKLPRQPGTKESRFAHLFSGPVTVAAPDAAPPPTPSPATPAGPTDRERLAQLEAELAELKRQFAEFRKQFE